MDVPRTDPSFDADERTVLGQFLDYHRATFLGKIAGLDAGQLATRLPSSSLTLAGLCKHLTYVEDSWFQEDLLGLPAEQPWAGVDWEADPDWEFRSALDDDPTELVAGYEAACERSRRAAESCDSLDTRAVRIDAKTGEHPTLRWILLHMIEETARHNGHADLLREAIDGETGE